MFHEIGEKIHAPSTDNVRISADEDARSARQRLSNSRMLDSLRFLVYAWLAHFTAFKLIYRVPNNRLANFTNLSGPFLFASPAACG